MLSKGLPAPWFWSLFNVLQFRIDEILTFLDDVVRKFLNFIKRKKNIDN
jgi:hypothetical protein